MSIYDLKTLLIPWKISVPLVFIKDIVLDSRYVFPGDVFVAINGHQDDGRFYILDAIIRGASAVITELSNDLNSEYVYYINNVPIICLYNLKSYLSLLSGRLYNHPSYLLNLIGVTGTNGKTTVTHFLCQWVYLLCEKTAVMGTIGNGIFNDLSPSINTTSSAIDIQKMLAYFYRCDVSFVAMEVSSHALVQHRVRDLYFQAAVFTNLTHDHLDYHGNMLAYESAKWILFGQLKVKEFIINGDDFVGFRWLLKLLRGTAVVWNRKLPSNWCGRWLRVISVRRDCFGTNVCFDSSWGKGLIHTQLIGRYNISNLLLSLATLLTLNYPLNILLEKVSKLRSVSGRMEIFKVSGAPTVVVDYAHTPDALKQVLLEIRFYCSGKIWCVFGCGGNRDRKKRPMMGKIAEKYADYVILTNDNPRTEDSKSIINDIRSGVMDSIYSQFFKVIADREEALKNAICYANSNDWILIAGKGHENYQVVGYNKFIYSDQAIIKGLLDMKK